MPKSGEERQHLCGESRYEDKLEELTQHEEEKHKQRRWVWRPETGRNSWIIPAPEEERGGGSGSTVASVTEENVHQLDFPG